MSGLVIYCKHSMRVMFHIYDPAAERLSCGVPDMDAWIIRNAWAWRIPQQQLCKLCVSALAEETDVDCVTTAA